MFNERISPSSYRLVSWIIAFLLCFWSDSAQSALCFEKSGDELRSAVQIYLQKETKDFGEEKQELLAWIQHQFGEDIASWCVDKVQNFSFVFAQTHFNRDISSWNVSSATEMDGMFQDAAEFNQNLCSWGSQIANQVSVRSMFLGSACIDTSPPVQYTFQNSTTTRMGPFCTPCIDNGQMAKAFDEALQDNSTMLQSLISGELHEETKVEEPPATTGEYAEKPFVHSHESISSGVQLVLLLLVVFSLNSLALATLCRDKRRLARHDNNVVVADAVYSPLSLSGPTEQTETELTELSNGASSEII